MDRYKLWFDTLMKNSDEGFIIVDQDGIVQEINDNYCRFLLCRREDAIGKKVETLIPNTSFYDVIRRRQVGPEPVWFLEYSHAADYAAMGNRFCLFDENGNVVGAMAQVKFRDQTWFIADFLYKKDTEHQNAGQLPADSDGIDLFSTLIGADPKFLNLKTKAQRIAPKDFSVFLDGETGTGKEVFAKAIHMASSRSNGPMISINCGAIPPELLESELFGYEEGAFTGARRGGKIGKFELANGGTLFLDEIGDLPFHLQVKLLRVLQEGEIERVGGKKPVPIDVRVISATRMDLESMMHEGTFREDLYYRLNVINLHMIPLRERPGDILLFARYFLHELNRKYKTTLRLSPAVERSFQQYSWPGNIREVKNVISSAYASSEGLVIELEDLPPKIVRKSLYIRRGDGQDESLHDMVERYESIVIRDTLEQCGQRIKETAARLRIDRSLLYKKMKKYHISIQKVQREGR